MKHAVSQNIIILMTWKSTIPCPNTKEIKWTEQRSLWINRIVTWIYPSFGRLGIDFDAARCIITVGPRLLPAPNRQIARFSSHQGSPYEAIERRLSRNPIALLAKHARILRIAQTGERHAWGLKRVRNGRRPRALAGRVDLSDSRIPVEILERTRERERGRSISRVLNEENARDTRFREPVKIEKRGEEEEEEEGTHVVFLVVDDNVRSGRSHDSGLSVKPRTPEEREREREWRQKLEKTIEYPEGRREKWDVKMGQARKNHLFIQIGEPSGPTHLAPGLSDPETDRRQVFHHYRLISMQKPSRGRERGRDEETQRRRERERERASRSERRPIWDRRRVIALRESDYGVEQQLEIRIEAASSFFFFFFCFCSLASPQIRSAIDPPNRSPSELSVVLFSCLSRSEEWIGR